jgi:hypothetical protein
MATLSNIYNANFKKVRGKASQGFVRPTLSEFFMSNKDFVDTTKGFILRHGDPEIFENAAVSYNSVSKINNTSAIVCYTDEGNSNRGTACLLDWSTGTIVSDTPVVFETGSVIYISVSVIDETSAIVCYQDASNATKGTACILNWSTDTIIPDTPVVFEAGETKYISCIVADETKAVVAYQDKDASQAGRACLLDWSTGTLVTSTPVSIPSNTNKSYYTSLSKISSEKAVVCFADSGNGVACLLDWSTGTIVPGTQTDIFSSNPQYVSCSVIDENRAIICLRDYLNRCQSILINWSTGDILVEDTELVSTGISYAGDFTTFSCSVLSNTQAIICFRHDSNSGFGTFSIIDWLSGEIVIDELVVFESAVCNHITCDAISSTKAIVCYEDIGGNSYGVARILG